MMQFLWATVNAVEELYLLHADITNHQFPSEHN